ncbi:MAG: S9 family peptidase [Opitutaceae bacterium]
MLSRTRWMVAGLLLALCSHATAKPENLLERMTPVPKTEPIPVIDFFRPSLFSGPELNPAGTYFAALTTVSVDRREVVVCELATGKYRRLYGPGKRDIRNVNWMGNEHLIFNVEADNGIGLQVAPLHDLGLAYPVDYRTVAFVLSSPRTEPEHPLVWIRHSAGPRGGDIGVHQIDGLVRSDTRSDIRDTVFNNRISTMGTAATVIRSYPQPEGGKVRSYITNNEGKLAYAVTIDSDGLRLHWFDDKNWRPCPMDPAETEIVAVGDQPNQLLVLSPRVENKPRSLHYLNSATGELGDIVFQDDKYDLAHCRPYRHPVDGHILGLRFERLLPTTVWFDAAYQALQQKIERSLGQAATGAVVSIIGSDHAEKRFFVSVRSDRRPTAYLLVDIAKGAISPVAPSIAPWLDAERMRPMTFLSYKNREGVSIDAYLTLPEGASKENPPPLVVLPHGGPWVRDSWGFDSEVQFLASRGYAVFQPNYRGSLGTQWRFPVEDLWAFRKMHDDVTDGVQKLVKSGLVDPDRIAIMGGSFGGYLAVSGVAHEPALYRCAVALSGVYDWAEMIKQARRFESDGASPGRTAMLRRFLGDPKSNEEKFEAISPVRVAGQIKVPVFVAHGKSDYVAPVEQSEQLVAELKRNGIPHETYFQRGEGHGMADLEHRVKLYTLIEAFLAKNLAPRPAAPMAPSAAPAAP